MAKKIKTVAKKIRKQAGVLVKKSQKQAGRAAKSLKQEWKKEEPRRKKFAKELKMAAGQALKDGTRIGRDIVQTVKKDLVEINRRGKSK